MKAYYVKYITANPYHNFGLFKQEVGHLPSDTTFLHFFSLMTREKCIVNNVGWKIPNDNYSRGSHLEETEYTGN